uniref:Ig-like domain-containing protein n=1 Tax=Myripristis murdjan TaxID=586833 RepID=A0A667Z275_9TELE
MSSGLQKRMSPSGTLLGLCCVCLLAALDADSQATLYKKAGDTVMLTLDLSSVTGPITSIVWKHNRNLAMEWDGKETDSFRNFKERGHLNNSTGVLTITGLTISDSGSYAAEINNRVILETELKVIAPVPKPTISVLCDTELTYCGLSCDGNTTDAEPVTYIWNKDEKKEEAGLLQLYQITKEEDSTYTQFSCTLQNKVSESTSEPVNNPLAPVKSPDPGELKLKTGVIVFISLVAVLLVSVFVHRWKAGGKP